jgi:hypothetical protein
MRCFSVLQISKTSIITSILVIDDLAHVQSLTYYTIERPEELAAPATLLIAKLRAKVENILHLSSWKTRVR